MDLLNVCAGVTIKILTFNSSFEMSYSSESPGELGYFGTEKKLTLAGLCFMDPAVPCPFSSLFLFCRLTDASFILFLFFSSLNYRKLSGPKGADLLPST